VKVLLTGAAGQLGQSLIAACPEGVQLFPCRRQELDLSDQDACRRLVREHQPDWVLNAGAYTAVDRAESEAELAHAVNALAPAALAEAQADHGGQLLQLSTDFVFNGQQGCPYRPEQAVDPLGVYGSTKAAGEAAALGYAGTRVLRTSWVYGPVGSNFCLTMLRLLAEREQLGVVADQVGCPTSTLGLAQACWGSLVLEESAPRILHWSDAGAASWYDFAVAIAELGQQLGVLTRAAHVNPIGTADYPTPAKRPAYSLLDCSETRQVLGLEPQHWRASLSQVLLRIASSPARASA
jgi:dTDP-4-dehydrorhamnose reductase